MQDPPAPIFVPPAPYLPLPTLPSSSTGLSTPPASTIPQHKRTLSKPQTPKSSTSATFSNGRGRPTSSESRRKAVFTTCRSYPDTLPAPVPFEPETELHRSQRRSKVEAMSKLDRGGTPIQLTAGPTATCFLPASAQHQPAAGPSNNPLLRPKVVNPPFDLNSVRTEAPRRPATRTEPRLFGLEECPVYYPTAREFQNPMAYISSISPEARRSGICKIVPPEGWRMPFSLETDIFRFKSRLQRLNSLEATSRAKINFLDQLTMYHRQQGDAKVSIPVIERKALDLWRLRKEVTKLGGYEAVTRVRGWGNIAEMLGYDAEVAVHIRAAYTKIILPFEMFLTRAKSSSASPLTPLSNGLSGPRPPPGFHDSPGSPTRRPAQMRMGSAPSGLRKNSISPRGMLSPLPSFPLRPASAAPGIPATRIKVPGFVDKDGTESDLSEESLSPPPAEVKAAYQKGEVCEICQFGHAADKILLCDGCDRGFHTYCLDPPLSSVPSNEEWYCTPCLLSQGDDYGFEEGEEHSIPSFQARDAAFAYAWWNKHRPVASTSNLVNPDPLGRRFGKAFVTEDDVEREFWRLTESSNDTVEVEYGADVHSTTHGSAAPTLETHPLDPYARDGWNLNNMPILPESLLRYIKSDISGMTVPWIYIGMLFSTFCWHNEDHYTYSINYMFWGETKTWYGIPGEDAYKFEAAIKSEAPELFEQQPGLLFQLVTMMNPGRLKEAGVRVVACDQRPNEFVITFPKAYHCGFNDGINFNEAVNFALPDWLPDGKECVVRYKHHAKLPVFSHNELLITITMYSETIKTAIWLKDSLIEMVDQETARRDRLRAEMPLLVEALIEEDGPEDQYQCCICKGFCYLSQITCSCTKAVACFDHADLLCSCPKSNRILRKRYSEAQLEEILGAVVLRAAIPENWRNRFYSLLEAPRPPLKSMRALLADGEKIAHPMAEVEDLRTWVARANAWVEKVTTLATRKSIGRRKKAEDDGETAERSPEALSALLREAERLAFDAPEILQLRQMLLSIQNFQAEAILILSTDEAELDVEKCNTALILGRSLNMEMPEIAQIQTIVNRLVWFQKVEEEVDDRTIQYPEVVALLEEAEEYGISPTHPTIVELHRREEKGRKWKSTLEALLEGDRIELQDVEALIEGHELTPTIIDLMRQLEGIRKTALNWQSSAKAFLTGSGTAHAAVRLSKAVSGAKGPVRKVHILEMKELDDELDFHAEWAAKVEEVLNVPIGKIGSKLEEISRTMSTHLDQSDDKPNDEHACFCRNPPQPIMIACSSCAGSYHPKCANVLPKNATNPFRCDMCKHEMVDDRPSLHALGSLADTHRWNFLLPPSGLAEIEEILDQACRFAVIAFQVADPHYDAVANRDLDLIAHLARKLFNLPICFDAINSATNERIVLEDWLYKRMHDARHPQPVTTTTGKIRTRARRGKIVLAESREGDFVCLCSSPPLDALLRVRCVRCRQSYHMSCVKAPLEAGGAEGKAWRCPCCSVNEGKTYLRNVALRVQLPEHVGTDKCIDYRLTINNFKTELQFMALPVGPSQISLTCTRFVPPIIPDDFHLPPEPSTTEANGTANGNGSGHGDGEGEPKKKRRRANAAISKVIVPDVEVEVVNMPGSRSHSTGYGSGPSARADNHGNGHAYSNGHGNGHGSGAGYPPFPATDHYRPNQPRTILDQSSHHSHSHASHPWAPPSRDYLSSSYPSFPSLSSSLSPQSSWRPGGSSGLGMNGSMSYDVARALALGGVNAVPQRATGIAGVLSNGDAGGRGLGGGSGSLAGNGGATLTGSSGSGLGTRDRPFDVGSSPVARMSSGARVEGILGGQL